MIDWVLIGVNWILENLWIWSCRVSLESCLCLEYDSVCFKRCKLIDWVLIGVNWILGIWSCRVSLQEKHHFEISIFVITSNSII